MNQLIQPPPLAPFILTDNSLLAGGASGVLTANTVYVLAVQIQSGLILAIPAMTWKTTATTTGTTDAGIYDANGNQLSHTGAIANVATSNMRSNLLIAQKLPSGKYYLAMTPSNSTDTYTRVTNFGTVNAIAACYTAANAGTAGVLPATLGALTVTAIMPVIGAAITGGI